MTGLPHHPKRHPHRRPAPGVAGAVVAVVTVVVLALAGCSTTATIAGAGSPTGVATVSRVVDGDTLLVRLAGKDERVRLLGIDTPETVKPRTPVQCFGKEASNRTKSLLPGGTAVRVVRDTELRDDYGRLLAYVYRTSDGLFVNLSLVQDGFAVPDMFPPNVAHAPEITAAARAARSAGRGIWSACPTAAIPHHAGGP
jgi:micrococcal nuclease